jgi:ATP-dependent Lon protease
LNKYLYPDAL